MRERIGGWFNEGLAFSQCWLDRRRERGKSWLDDRRQERDRTKKTREHLRSLQEDIRELINKIYDASPTWQRKVEYHIAASTLNNIDCRTLSPSLLIFCPELEKRNLTSIFITKDPEPLIPKETPEIKINLHFLGLKTVELHFSQAGKSKLSAELPFPSGPATFTSKIESKGRNIGGAILRSQAIKEVLSTVLSLKQPTRTISNP